MSHLLRQSLAVGLAVLGLGACVTPVPARILVASDTVVVNGPNAFRLAVTAIDSRGDTLPSQGLSFDSDDSSVVDLSHAGSVRCRSRGDASVVVSQAGIAARLTVLCRPIHSFDMPMPSRLVLGQQPAPLTFIAYDSDFARITQLAGVVSVRDTLVVKYAGGLVHPVAVGGTYVDMDFGGESLSLPFFVVRRAVDERLAMVAGEMKTWPLPPGRSELLLAGDSTRPDGERPRLDVYRANCARGPRRIGEQHWYCVGTQHSRAIVRDVRPIGSPGVARASLQVFEIPH